MKRSRKIEIKVSLYKLGPLLRWMFDSGMPFLAKARHQKIWTPSRKATPFMEKFKPDHRSARTQNGVERLVDFQFIVLNGDWSMIEWAILMRWPKVKIKTPRKYVLDNRRNIW